MISLLLAIVDTLTQTALAVHPHTIYFVLRYAVMLHVRRDTLQTAVVDLRLPDAKAVPFK
jgi:hypothetical protein